MLCITIITLVGIVSGLLVAQKVASAADARQFQAGRIIDDAVFTNYNSMNAAQIQQFLNNKNSVCLKNFRGQSLVDDNGDGVVADTTTETYGRHGTMTAAQLINAAAKIYRINPQVILVTLQKEQSLITGSDCSNMNTALGYGCPDSTPGQCAASAKGFTRQIDYGAYHFRGYFNDSLTYVPFGTGNHRIQYNPSSSCGSSVVNIQNRATASLYSYTPYQPNQAALNAGYGSASCGAYGNRNFFLFFSDWFGSTFSNDTVTPHPDGTLFTQDGVTYVVSNGTKRRIMNADIFTSWGYRWGSVKRATTGDRNLPIGIPIDIIKPGKLFRAGSTGSVYIMVWENSAWRKQHISLSSFNALGYKWGEIQSVSASFVNSIPASSIVYTQTQHPTETLVVMDGSVYMVDHGTRRYVSSHVYNSHAWPWSSVKPATQADRNLPLGATYFYREGSILSANSNLYVIDIPASGQQIASPIGPWECYSGKFSFTAQEALKIPVAALPVQRGATVTCS